MHLSPSTSSAKALLLGKHAGYCYLAIALLGMFAPAFFDVDAIAPILMAWKYLGLPIFGLCLYAFLSKDGPTSKAVGVVFATLLSLLLIMVSSGYLFIANVLGPGQRETQVEGRIIRLRNTGNKIRRYEVTIVDAAGKRTELDVGWAEYNRLAVGQAYSARWKIGSLGIMYK